MQPTDADIVRRVLAGETDAFSVLVDRYYDRYARYAVRTLGNREDAEEALQDAFLRAYRALPKYREEERFAAWLMRILVNTCRTTAARRTVRERPFAAEADAALLEERFAVPGAGTEEAHATADLVRRALETLPAEQRETLLLRYTDDLTYEDIAAITGVGVSALKMRVKRAFARLRELLSEGSHV